jgi:hypothetical protein
MESRRGETNCDDTGADVRRMLKQLLKEMKILFWIFLA